MKTLKKTLALTLSAAMTLSMSSTVFATTPSTDNGTANVLAHSVDAYLVPTTLKIALNPDKMTVITSYKKTADAALNAAKTYYVLESGKYKKVASPAVGDIGTYYEQKTTSTAQVVSFNYGIVNKGTTPKDVKVSLEASYTATDGKTAIEFVESPEYAYKKDATHPLGAESGEMKMYLAVASAGTNGVTAVDTYYFKTEDTAVDSSKTYYTEASGVYTAVTSAADESIGTYYESSTDLDKNVTSAALSNVTMTAATAGVTPLIKGTSKTTAEVTYELGKATYNVKTGENIDFDTTQETLADKVELTALGGAAGFTLTGVLNEDTDWTKADTAAISIAPTYTVTDADAYNANRTITGAKNQVGVNATGALVDGALKISVTGCLVSKTKLLSQAKLYVTGVKDGKKQTADVQAQCTFTDNTNYKEDGKYACVYGAAGVNWWDANTPLVWTVELSDGSKITGVLNRTQASGTGD